MGQHDVKSVESGDRPRHSQDRTPWAWMVLLLALAGFLRLYRLDDQLWLDEIAALTQSYRKPFLEILTTFPGYIPHPLYDLLAHTGLVLFGESPLVIRLPAALFGVAGVLMFYRLARRLSGPGEALLAAALLTVSYHHVFFSQNARGYTVFLFFALAATELLLKLLETMRWPTALAYAGAAVLATYAHPFGLFVPIGQILVAFFVVWFRRRRGNWGIPASAHLLGVALLTLLAILILYAPFIQGSLAFTLTTARAPGHGPKVFSLLPELVEGLRAAFSGGFGMLLATAVGAIGVLDFLRRQPVALATLVVPLLVAVLVVGMLGVGVHPRYFLLALPVGYLVGTRGLAVGARTILAWGRPGPAVWTTKMQEVLALLVVVLAALPLMRYYAIPKQDYLGALRQVRMWAAKEDRVVAADLAGHAIQAYYDQNFPIVEDLKDLRREEALGGRVWVVTTLERVMGKRVPDLLAHLHRQYRLVRVLPGSLGDGAMRIYMREVGEHHPQRNDAGP